MSNPDLDQLLSAAVTEVLETMFFSETLGPGQPDLSETGLESQVTFAGDKSGTVGVRISKAAARCLAASFLGESEDALSDIQIAQVICELTNMLCGCIVSKVATHGCFDLGSPELLGESSETSIHRNEKQQSFAMERGTLTVSLTSRELA